MTKHYPLFFQGIVLHSGSSKDIEDRYLLSRSFGNLTLEDIKRDFGLYSGGGPLKTQPLAYNQSVTFCEIVSYLDSNRECPSRTDPIKLRGEDYFREMESRFESIKKNQDPPLKKFNVEYVVIDRNNEKIVPATLQNTLYDDGRFLILALPF